MGLHRQPQGRGFLLHGTEKMLKSSQDGSPSGSLTARKGESSGPSQAAPEPGSAPEARLGAHCPRRPGAEQGGGAPPGQEEPCTEAQGRAAQREGRGAQGSGPCTSRRSKGDLKMPPPVAPPQRPCPHHAACSSCTRGDPRPAPLHLPSAPSSCPTPTSASTPTLPHPHHLPLPTPTPLALPHPYICPCP